MGILIVDGERHFGADLETVMRNHPDFVFAAGRLGVTVPPLTDVAKVPPAPARINQNRWIVDCPDCGGAEYAFRDTPLMMCASCFNGGIGGKWRPVVFPPAKKLAVVESVLGLRPNPATRNWSRGESVAALRRENKERL